MDTPSAEMVIHRNRKGMRSSAKDVLRESWRNDFYGLDKRIELKNVCKQERQGRAKSTKGNTKPLRFCANFAPLRELHFSFAISFWRD
jgi:hypothetical protein